MIGSDGNDAITGGGFGDSITGGGGHDTLTGSGGADTFFFASNLATQGTRLAGGQTTLANVDFITDFDAGLEGSGIPAVTQEEVFAFFEANVDTVRKVLFRALQADLPTARIEAGPGFEPA